uniref:Uncharacterized protein n=1 Tax=Oryza glumipatula TaxID=40148 RepID=A0A0E0AIE8_9ORYZ
MVERPRRRRPSVFPSDAPPGKWSPSEGVREEARTASVKACFGRLEEVALAAYFGGGKEGEVREWIRLDETKLVARELGRKRSGKGDRWTAGHG